MDGSKPRILFLDDDANHLAGIRRSLRSRAPQWDMAFMEHGETALQRHCSLPFDVVVVDMLMPGVCGQELVAQFNQSCSPPACIVLTGMSDLHEVSRLFNSCDVFRFFTKPARREELVESIEIALDAHRNRTHQVAVESLVNTTVLERDILDSLSRGVLVVDENMRPLYMNQSATALIAQRRGLAIDARGVLKASSRTQTQQLHTLVDRVIQATPHCDENMHALTLEVDTQHAPLMLVAMPSYTAASSNHNCAVLFISGFGAVQSQSPGPDIIASMLGITHTEARLVEKLSQGINLEAAAQEMGVTLSSARTYIKRIQKKTGTSRQLDLIRMVLEIPLP